MYQWLEDIRDVVNLPRLSVVAGLFDVCKGLLTMR